VIDNFGMIENSELSLLQEIAYQLKHQAYGASPSPKLEQS
jgi:hypothetical protein